VNTADIVGGNSGSPVVDRNGDLVGIVFDGNLESLVLDYTYTEQKARAVAVDSAAILEALRKVYAANWLLDELAGKK
jgi:V8-like Glu-specific endopeptidase